MTVSWPPLEVEDNSDNATTRLTIGQPPGSTFSVGYHVIKYDAQDFAGNKAYPCVFTVKVDRKEYFYLLCFNSLITNRLWRSGYMTQKQKVCTACNILVTVQSTKLLHRGGGGGGVTTITPSLLKLSQYLPSLSIILKTVFHI